jgi:hypothetical protein
MKRYADAVQAAVADASGLTAAMPATVASPMQVGIESPWTPTPNQLQSIVWADLVGTDVTILSRAAVMAIPAHARQRHLLCGAVSGCPLRGLDGPTDAALPLEDQPTWMHRTDTGLPPFHRMLWTVDDLIHYGWSLWWATRGHGDVLLSAERIAYERWETDEVGRVMVDGDKVRSNQVILIPGPHEGVLNFGGPALRRTIANLDAAANAAANPAAYLELHYTGEVPLTDPEIDALIARWVAARKGVTGGVAYTSKNVELKEHGSHEAQLLIDGRNADAVDVSRLVSSPAAMADATSAGASLTYETTSGRNTQFLDYGAKFYMDAIAARLSMDDVVPRGQRTAFDVTSLTSLTPSPTGAQQND